MQFWENRLYAWPLILQYIASRVRIYDVLGMVCSHMFAVCSCMFAVCSCMFAVCLYMFAYVASFFLQMLLQRAKDVCRPFNAAISTLKFSSLICRLAVPPLVIPGIDLSTLSIMMTSPQQHQQQRSICFSCLTLRRCQIRRLGHNERRSEYKQKWVSVKQASA